MERGERMSYSICRIAKIKASGVTGIQIHDQREKDGISHTNEDIDWTKTSENVFLLEQQERFRTVVSNRIAELNLKRKPRSDATVMCQCLVTSDNAFFEKMNRQKQTEYFKKSLDFIKERYGEKNLVSATIHYDERTPHMHVNFVPVTEDGRLSAKDLFSPKSLRMLQDDYNRFVREQGYDLERGDIGSKTKHLEVEEYKLETKYEQLKAKEQRLEQLEKVDTAIELQAEKGKLTYSTKEVESIKEQNRALKLENYHKDETIRELQDNLDKAEKRLLMAQNDLKGIKVPLNRLKDLESENRALEHLRKNNPSIDKLLERFDRIKETAYALGNKLAECKKRYHNCLDEREKLITRSSGCEKMAKEYDRKTNDIAELKQAISTSLEKETFLRAELDGIKGIFKKKAREDCQSRLEQQEKETEQLQNRLQKEHDCRYEHIQQKIYDYTSQKRGLLHDKAKYIEQTNRVEQMMEDAVHTYKFHKGIADTQQIDMREITNRIHAEVQFRPGEDKVFRLTQADRKNLLKEYEEKGVAKRTIEHCRENFERQDIQERNARELSKQQAKTHTRGRER